jgi:catechol 2,3-dioxygenase-like lactoylglutathione lyase family enzyme
MLGSAEIVAFVPTRNPGKARQFYEKTLGLEFIVDDRFALVFEANGVTIRVVNVSGIREYKPFPFTILGWNVGDIVREAKALQNKGVKLERYPGLEQDEVGIWSAPGGAKVAWFKDPDGNTLSLSQHQV